MKSLTLVLAGIVGGLLGGMGLGGGTLLMPILTLKFGIAPKLASWLNLISFLPAAALAVIVHAKNGLIARSKFFGLLAFAAVGATMVYAFGGSLSERTAKTAFGWFLIAFGSLSLLSVMLGFFSKKRRQ